MTRLTPPCQPPLGAAAKPPVFAFPSPRPPLGGITKEMQVTPAGCRRPFCLPAKTAGSKVRGPAAPAAPLPLTKTKPSGVTRGLSADFFGAIPVASALGTAAGATPPQQLQLIIMGDFDSHPKPELSTLLGIGTFYFALTQG